MNLPARLRRWDVHGESLAIEGTGADVIVDWIADDEDETAKIQINRLMGVITRFIPTVLKHKSSCSPITFSPLFLYFRFYRHLFPFHQFSSRGELPALVVYSTPGVTPSKTTGYAAEFSLRDILDAVSQDDDLRAKFRYSKMSFKLSTSH
jgi:hypothetical protein